ncbi:MULTISPECIES: polyphosphate--glucose phosphotransferase [Nocardiaceae]|uniref:Polyphosphate glucokinase n=1 Tax=Rhodococcoides fascians TaxID=1828 RepID=A0A143QQL6_RHOFA|nr:MULTISPECIES: ROK family protein [Rhodococcus]AMY25076.1 Polyphosphate glucokinase [Rhodococcus fascians]MBJ7322283.1 ROK family protein [Rhodococcus sp. (in: high G+C Gram-positive bacteria)]MBW4777783.1 ROK family protein [Rhodococcus fascians]MDJ0001579.1 ROK family protein [Rhodococcus fascians]OZC40233.1 ROK family protein [Rhodococcus fascians]
MTQPGSDNSTAATAERHGFGVDVGGSGIKGGIVDLNTGELVGDRYKIETPQPSTPDAVARTVAEIVAHFEWTGPIGVTLPAVVTNGVARSAANIDKSWIDTDARALFADAIGNENITVLNDADAAGVAEDKYGGGKGKDGVVVLLTFGTGIGSAVLHNGVLLPNTEFGHMEIGGKEAEHRAASSVKENKGLSYKEWAKEVSTVLATFEALLWPDLFIAGGGISRKSEKWIPHLTNRTPVVPATLLNTAGIVGAALAADSAVASAETGTSAGSPH